MRDPCARILQSLQGEKFEPPVHDAIGLGKEAMAADIEAIPFVVYGPGDAAHMFAQFEHDGPNIGPREQFPGRGEACRAGAYNDCGSLIHIGPEVLVQSAGMQTKLSKGAERDPADEQSCGPSYYRLVNVKRGDILQDDAGLTAKSKAQAGDARLATFLFAVQTRLEVT